MLQVKSKHAFWGVVEKKILYLFILYLMMIAKANNPQENFFMG